MNAAGVAAVLFDKDGTLLDYHRSWTAIACDAAALAAQDDPVLARRLLVVGGADPDTARAEADSLLAAAGAAEIARAWVAAGSAFSVAALTAALDALFTNSVSRVVPVLDLAPFFAGLKSRGLKLGIASSDSAAAIHATATRFGFAADVDFVAGYDSGFGIKPGPGMLRAFCAAVGVPPSRTAMVGDNRHDMDMGRAAGAGLCVGVLTGTGTRATLACADIVLDSIADLDAVLSGRGSAPAPASG